MPSRTAIKSSGLEELYMSGYDNQMLLECKSGNQCSQRKSFLKKNSNCVARDYEMVYFSCTMASQADPKKDPTPPCPHLRLVLETTPDAGYLTGGYICEEC